MYLGNISLFFKEGSIEKILADFENIYKNYKKQERWQHELRREADMRLSKETWGNIDNMIEK
ncbi:hypothetical protein [Bacillus sp. V5-8f]|uniref:hypothetical protein n=1 Tax=Bacillus sp. V5-8f TaxID=2053044 RepID=UPI000C7859CB|nr:hypothetical protein [Bacillus sp. V5-8f]PLT33631.1 hypothetical protein CUU64_10900 [Bacillus sp. V5-8f]